MDQGPAARQLVKDFVATKSVETSSEDIKIVSNWNQKVISWENLDFVFEYKLYKIMNINQNIEIYESIRLNIW